MKRIFQCLAILVICFLLLPLYPTKAEPKPRLIVSLEILNFNRITKADIPTLKFTVRNNEKGPIQGTLKPSKKWIHLSQLTFNNDITEISVTIDPAWFSFQPGLYLEKIEIESDGGNFTLPVRLDLVEKRIKIEFSISNTIARIDGKKVEMRWAPYVRKGKMFIPVDIVFESIGAMIFTKNDEEKQEYGVNVEYKDIYLTLIFGKPTMILNRKEYKIVEPEIWGGNIYAEWRIIYQIFGAKVSYEISERKITIEY